MKKNIQGFGGGGKSGGGGGVEASDTLRSIQYAVFIDAISEGPIRGLVNGMQSVYFNQVPLQNADGSFNFVSALVGSTNTSSTVNTTYYATSNGDLNGNSVASALSGIPGMNGSEYESNVSVPVTHAAPHTERITANNVDHVRITIGFEAGLTHADSSGNINGTSVDLAIDLQKNGAGFVQVIADTVSGKSSSKYQRSYLISLTGTGPFDVRVRRVTGDNNSSLIADKFSWETYTGIISTQLAYPHTAWAAFRIDATQFSGIPTRAYDIYGLIIKVPSNYDPITRTYSGTWDGTFKLSWSNNPAWVFYDLATNSRYGLGDYLGTDAVDKWRLYSIAQYCDAMVADGSGGTEPRFVCNLYIQGQQEAYKVMQDLASVFNSITYWGGGELLVSQDAPADVVSIFTNANVIDGLFSYQGTSIKARHTVALVAWNDPADFCKQKIEYVQDDDGVRKYGVIKSDISAFGCTSRGQAHRFGRSILFTEKYETEICTFKCGLDGAYIFPGAIIQTSDLTRAGKRMGGRIVSATSVSVVLDAPFTAIGGMAYTIIIIAADGSVMTAGVSSFNGAAVALSQSLPVQALAGAVFIIAESDIQPEMWRVAEVSESAPNELTVSCVSHNPSKYATIENGAPLAIIPTSNIKAIPGQVSNIVLTVGSYFTAAGVSCLLSWNAATSTTSYTVSWAASNGLTQTQTVFSTSLDIACLAIGVTYSFSITANSSIGIPSSPVFFTQEVLAPNAPSGVGSFTATAGTNGIVLAWTDIGYPHLYDYEIRFGSNWDSAVSIGFFNGTTTTVPMKPTGTYTWMIKARDVSLNYSVNPAIAALTIGPPGVPIGITATGGYQSIYLAWTNPTIANYGYTEIFESATNSLAAAVSIAQISGNAFTRSGLTAGTTMYYWLRTVNNVQQPSSFSSTVSAATLSNPAQGLPGAPGAAAQTLSISGFTGFSENAGGAFTPTSATLNAVLANVTSPSFTWTVTGGTPTSGTSSAITVVPNQNAQSVTASLSVTGTNLASPLSQSLTMPVVLSGVPGQAGANGVMSAVPTIYQWTTSATPPAMPSTVGLYTWSSGTFAPPTGWFVGAPTNTTPGSYLWQIECFLTVTATTSTSPLNWSAGTMAAVSYNGATGATGASGSATYLVNRGASSTSGAPTTAEVLAAVSRAAVAGDIATVLYNSGNNAASFLFAAGAWAAQSAYITGSLIVQNTITSQQIAANSITADRIDTRGLSIKDAAGNVVLSAGSSLGTQVSSTVGSGNLLANSDFSNGTCAEWISTWVQYGSPSDFQGPVIDYAGLDWAPAGGHAVSGHRNGTTAVTTGSADIYYNRNISVLPGGRYEISGYLASHSSQQALCIWCYKLVSGAETYITELNQWSAIQGNGGQNLNSWERVGAFYTVPSDCTYVRVGLRQGAATAADPYFWATKLYFGQAGINQTALSSWSAGGAFGALSSIDQINSGNVSTYIANTAIDIAHINTASIGSLSALTAVIGDVYSGSIRGGAYGGYGWPGAGAGGGFYLGPPGLLMGSANDGKYFQVTSAGDIYAPGFNVVNGTLNINQANVINTLQIAGQAVTIPLSSTNAATTTLAGSGNSGMLASVGLDTGGNPVYVHFSGKVTASGANANIVPQMSVLLDGGAYKNYILPNATSGLPSSFSFGYLFSSFPSGGHTIQVSMTYGSGTGLLICNPGDCVLFALGVKR